MTVRFRSDIRQWTDGAALAAHLWRHDAARLSPVLIPVAEWYTPTEGDRQ
jgi:hypothetical protein